MFSTEISPWSALTCYVTGLVSKILLDLSRERTGLYLAESKNIVRHVVGWSVRITQGLAMVAYWRGAFGLLSNNLGEGVGPVCLTLAISSLLLCSAKLCRCGVFPPLVLSTDSHHQTFQNGLYFRSSPGEQGFLPLDSVFSNFVVKTVPVIVWWALWCLENKYFSHNKIGEKDELISYDSLATGYGLAILVFITDKLLPYDQLHALITRLARLFITCTAILATLNVWRGVWSCLDHFFFPSVTGSCNYSLSLLVSIIGLTITHSSNTLGADFIIWDDDADGDVIDIQFWNTSEDAEDKTEMEKICDKNDILE